MHHLNVLKRFFVLAYVIAEHAANNEAGVKGNRKYFFKRADIKNYNVLIDGRFFMINQSII